MIMLEQLPRIHTLDCTMLCQNFKVCGMSPSQCPALHCDASKAEACCWLKVEVPQPPLQLPLLSQGPPAPLDRGHSSPSCPWPTVVRHGPRLGLGSRTPEIHAEEQEGLPSGGAPSCFCRYPEPKQCFTFETVLALRIRNRPSDPAKH
eukprot:TRINITY_DN19628_c0_g1_i2.p1 TRINITY_DN19628_c0_g1~~TRINITY_DN19628_c0_g1_i2.p1  ORF type:complete len:148 (+),score=5.56 TRINITY_DN19628_c0_g1_i2:332-775(+)